MSTNTTPTTFGIYRDGKRFSSKRYSSYEQARSAVRKKLREQSDAGTVDRERWDMGWFNYGNPSINRYGWQVKRVNPKG